MCAGSTQTDIYLSRHLDRKSNRRLKEGVFRPPWTPQGENDLSVLMSCVIGSGETTGHSRGGACPDKKYQTARGRHVGKASPYSKALQNTPIKSAVVIEADNAEGQRLIGPDTKENNIRHLLLSAFYSPNPVLKNWGSTGKAGS